jgi:hypothetical protein
MADSIARRLEQYTVKRSHEVLIVKAQIDGEFDEIAIFKGFSSSLTRSTASDPEVPVLPLSAKIVSVDRLQSPYNLGKQCNLYCPRREFSQTVGTGHFPSSCQQSSKTPDKYRFYLSLDPSPIPLVKGDEREDSSPS